jgi:hypothetical protein
LDLSGRGGNLFNAALDKLKPKELSLAIGGEYRVIKPLVRTQPKSSAATARA